MTTLIFRDKGWDVVTNAWTVASKDNGNSVTVCYVWAGPNFASAGATLPISLSQFLQRIAKGGIVDLR